MILRPITPTPGTWHTDDLLIRLANGESIGTDSSPTSAPRFTDRTGAANVDYGRPTLALVANDSERYERNLVLRSTTYKDDDLVAFGARTRSFWALDALIGRKTNRNHDWASFREAVLDGEATASATDLSLSNLTTDTLWTILTIVHERNLDSEVELELLRAIASRVIGGAAIRKQTIPLLVERLLQAGLGEEAQALLPKVPSDLWLRHALSVELRHPRFGGSYEAMFRVLNQTYRQLALEGVELTGKEGVPPFHQLKAVPQSSADNGPLVTVIMTCWNPGIEIFTAVRSIVDQTYQNWELIITDDASPEDVNEVLAELAALDSRIRIVRNEVNGGTYVRRNEAIQLARGEFVTMQDSDDWAHPRRLEIQALDLVRNPLRLANVVNALRMTEQLSVVSRRGARLFLAEPALMFRREAVVNAIGYYDSIRKSADTEYRKRLQAVTKREIPVLLPGAPLQIMLADEGSLSGADFGTNIWNHPDRLIYWSATRRYLQRIEAGEQDPYLPFPLPERAFHAPRRWTGQSGERERFDIIVVLDGREFDARNGFHANVIEELKAAAGSGLRVAVVQSDALVGPRKMTFFSPDFQALVDTGIVERVGSEDDIEADLVIVRHASAAQAHPLQRWATVAQRVVIIEDATAGDVRGSTIAKPDVIETVTSWFDVEPEWAVAPPTLPVPTISAVSVVGGDLRLTIETNTPSLVQKIRISDGEHEHELGPKTAGPLAVTATAKLGSDPAGVWTVSVVYDAGEGRSVARACAPNAQTVIWNKPDRIVVQTPEGALHVLGSVATENAPAAGAFIAGHAHAEIARAAVVGEQVELTVVGGNTKSLAAVYALREVDNAVVRRREFASATSADGMKVWRRPLSKFAGSGWQLIGSFRTPLGRVEYPLSFAETVVLEGNDNWLPQTRAGGRLFVGTPQPARVVRAVRKVSKAIESRLQKLPALAALATQKTVRSSGESSATPQARLHFDPQYGVPRIQTTPTVSVIMPVYNVEPYLDTAISSVLEQDFSDLELILIDDASTDNGRKILAKYWRKDPRVRVFGLDHNTLGGAGVPSNIGIRAARGEFIAFADSDDYVTQTGLARMVALAEEHEAEVVIGDFLNFSDKATEGERAYDHAAWNEFPLDTPISAFTHPDLFRLSPVPWRKLYRRDFMQANGILYPEGDYFYEDNPLHWFVLSRAQRVVACNEVISYHRQEREGQTMGAHAYKLGAFVSHANTVLNFISESTDERRDVLFEAFFTYLDRGNWTVKAQTQPVAAELIRRGLGDLYERAMIAAPTAPVPPLVRSRLATFKSAYPDLDLTIVIPVFNSADLISQTLDSVLTLPGLRFNVLVVDDGSTDESLSILREYEENFANVHVFAQGNRGAGRARNSIIPLCTGRYTYFLDADDVIDADALALAVAQADAEAADLMFVSYRIDFVDEGRSQPMFGNDREIWSVLPELTQNDQRQALLAQLVNYPWNRVIRTSLLHDANIFFGATIVHNDVLFHWHTIVSAQNISYLDVEVCAHRRFATRAQVTNINDGRRMAVLEALRSTHERISVLDGYVNVRAEWQKFALHLLEWAEDRIPASLRAEYGVRRKELTSSFQG